MLDEEEEHALPFSEDHILKIGNLVNALIIEKNSDHCVAQINTGNRAILPFSQVSDYSAQMLSEYMKINTGNCITCVILDMTGDEITLTCRPSFIKYRTSIPKTSQSACFGKKYIGYVSRHSNNGSYINFIGHATGFIPDIKMEIYDSVEVIVERSGFCPLLKPCFSRFLEVNFIQNNLKDVSDTSPKYKLGDIIQVGKKELLQEDDNNYFHYKEESDWNITVMPTYNGKPPFEAIVFYIDANNKMYYAVSLLNQIQKESPIAFRGKCVLSLGSISVLQFKQCYYFVKNAGPLEVGSLVYATVYSSIIEDDIIFHKPYCKNNEALPFFIGFIEKKQDNDCIRTSERDYCISFIYKEWTICTNINSNEHYFLHRTQIEGPIYRGLNIKAKMLPLNNITLLIRNVITPLFYEDCSEGNTVYGSLTKYDIKKKSHHIAISPFIEGILKEPRIDDKLYNTYKCDIVSITERKIRCNMMNSYTTVQIVDYQPGICYNVTEKDKNVTLDVTYCNDINFSRETNESSIINVFKIDQNNVAYRAPAIAYERIKTGDIVTGYIYKVQEDKLFVHVSRDIDGVILAENYADYSRWLNKLATPDIGKRITCAVLNDEGEYLMLSSRSSDVRCVSTTCYTNHYYRATVIDISDIIVLYADAIAEEIRAAKFIVDAINESIIREIGEEELSINSQVVVRYTTQGGFEIVSLEYKPLFDTPLTSDDNEMYIPLSETDEFEDLSEEDIHTISAVEDNELNRNIIQKRKHIEKELKKPSNVTINSLKQVVNRSYACNSNIKPQNLKLLVHYLKSIDSLENIDLISFKTNVGTKTIRKWFDKLKEDENWSPLILNKKITRKAMDDLLEDSIIYYIYTKFLSKGFQFNDRMCRSIAMQFWEQHPIHHLRSKFSASAKWIKRFKKKYNLVNRRVHYHRRPQVTQESIERCREFHTKMQQIYEKHKNEGTLHLLINVDETAWKVSNFGDLTWASKGVEHVEFTSDYDDKEMVTAIAAITASEEHFKLPLCLIRKGKTDRAKRIFDDYKRYFQIEVSPNGWSTVGSFGHYLIWLRKELDEKYKNIENYSPDQEIDVLLDLYASHRNETIKELATKLHFNLHYIPAGYTDEFQPLDRYVFGALKSMSRAIFYDEYTRNPEAEHSIVHACKILLDCWAKLSNDTIIKAWSIYSNSGNSSEIDSLMMNTKYQMDFVGTPLTINEEATSTTSSTVVTKEHYSACSEEEDEDEDDESDIAYDTLNEKVHITNYVVMQLEKIIASEDILRANSKGKRLVKPIENMSDDRCCYNATTQVVSILPSAREQFELMFRTGRLNSNKTLKAIRECLKVYTESNDAVGNLPLLSCIDMETDTCDNINIVLNAFNYGLCAEDGRVTSTINLIPGATDEIIPTLDYIKGKSKVRFNRAIAFRKEVEYDYKFDDIFEYDNYTFILKAVVCNKRDKHFYTYIRNKFSNEYYLANDSRIKLASKDQIDESPTVLGVYFIFDNEPSNQITDDSTSTNVRVTELEVSEELQSIIGKIESEYNNYSRKKKVFSLSNKTEKEKVITTYKEIAPHIRLTEFNPMLAIEEEIPPKMPPVIPPIILKQ